MVAINIKAIRGRVPRTSQRLQQPNFASRASNCKLTSGRLDPLGGMITVYEPVMAAIKSLFRYRYANAGSPLDYWLTFAGETDVVLNPLANDALGRFFFASEDHVPRYSTFADAISGPGPYPAASFALGLPNPSVVPAVSAVGGSAPTEIRAYVYTFVSRFGEETGPSPASNILTHAADGTWTLAGMQTAPANAGTVSAAVINSPSSGFVTVTLNTALGIDVAEKITFAGIAGLTDLNGTHDVVSVDLALGKIVVRLSTLQLYTAGGTWARHTPHNTAGLKKRIYRSAGTGGQFFFVAEVDAATTSYADTIPSALVNDPIATLQVLPPPRDLRSPVILPNGCMAGLSGNQLCISEPYVLNSFPLSNRYGFSGNGVTLTAAGSSLIVLTDTFPVLFTGTDPEGMSPSTMETYAPCVSRRGTVNVGGGCVYPSFDGLWLATPGRVEKLTQRLFRDDEWKLLFPASFKAAYCDGQYIAAYQGDQQADRRMWIFDIAEPDSDSLVDEVIDALVRNPYDGKLYVTQGNMVREWDAASYNQYQSDWISNEVQLPRPMNFAVAQIHADFQKLVPLNTDQIAANLALMADEDDVGGHLCGNELLVHEICGSLIVPVIQETAKKVQFTLYTDGVPTYTREVISSSPFRLPGGYRYEVVQLGMSASVSAYSLSIAESMQELKQVA